MSDDQVIVQRVRDGDREAFRTLVERHKDKVMAILTRLLGNLDYSEELAQETFVRAYQGLDGFRGESRFSTWLVQIALHVARNHIKQHRRQGKVVSLDALQERVGLDSRNFRETRREFSADSRVEDRELSARLQNALDAIPVAYREVFVLKHVQELSYEEISRITGQSVGSLKVRAHRARALLREGLREGFDPRHDSIVESRG